ncbi:MAG: hypothetical protein JWQ19_3828 [Subtercola sp.]|nr:hypothetical protein [Subtercola sp.]
MPRDRTARARIREFLVAEGPVFDPSGFATSMLREAIDYVGSPVAFIQLISTMERDNEIVREIKGKRTYRVSASESLVLSFRLNGDNGVGSSAATRPAVSLDYDVLARAIVRELLAEPRPEPVTSSPAGFRDKAVTLQREDYARRIDEARKQLDDLLNDAANFAGEPASTS